MPPTAWCSRHLAGEPLTKAGRPWVIVDTETTGLDLARDRLTELAAVVVDHDGKQVMEASWTRQDGRSALASLARDLDRPIVDGVLVAHNVRFDLAFLAREPATTDTPLANPERWLCTMQMSGIRRTLGAFAADLGVRATSLHTAPGDARTLALILMRLVALARARGLLTVAGLVVATPVSPIALPVSREGTAGERCWSALIAGLDRVVPVMAATVEQRRAFHELQATMCGPDGLSQLDLANAQRRLRTAGISAIVLERLLAEEERR